MKWTVFALMVSLTGCAMFQNQARVRENWVATHPDLEPTIKTALLAGEISKGMTEEEVRVAWGDPCWWCAGTTHNSFGTSWEYNVFGSSVYGAGNGTIVYFDTLGHVIGWTGP